MSATAAHACIGDAFIAAFPAFREAMFEPLGQIAKTEAICQIISDYFAGSAGAVAFSSSIP
jgi:hypothetical protein